MPTLSTERVRKYRAKHSQEEQYKKNNRTTVQIWRESNTDKAKEKNREYNRIYRDKLKQQKIQAKKEEDAKSLLASAIQSRKARQELKSLKKAKEVPVKKSYYQRKKEALLNGTPMVLMKRGRKPKATTGI